MRKYIFILLSGLLILYASCVFFYYQIPYAFYTLVAAGVVLTVGSYWDKLAFVFGLLNIGSIFSCRYLIENNFTCNEVLARNDFVYLIAVLGIYVAYIFFLSNALSDKAFDSGDNKASKKLDKARNHTFIFGISTFLAPLALYMVSQTIGIHETEKLIELAKGEQWAIFTPFWMCVFVSGLSFIMSQLKLLRGIWRCRKLR